MRQQSRQYYWYTSFKNRAAHFQDVKRDGQENYEWAPRRNRLKIQVCRVREPYIMGRARFPRHLGHDNKRTDH